MKTNKIKICFLGFSLLGITVALSIFFNLNSTSYIQGSSPDLKQYLLSFSDTSPKEHFSISYAPEILVQLNSNNSLSKSKLTISCTNLPNNQHVRYSEKEREHLFINTVLPHIIYANAQILKQRIHLLDILRDNLHKLTLDDYKKYMITRKVKGFKRSRLFSSNIRSLEFLRGSSLLSNRKPGVSLDLDFSIFSKNISTQEQKYIRKVKLKKYSLTKEEELYIKRLAYKNWLRRAAHINNPNLLLVALIASIDVIPPSLFLAQAKEESDLAQSRAAYTLNNLFGTQIPPNKVFNTQSMGRVCGSKTVRLRKFTNVQDTIQFQLEVYNQNTPMYLIKNNRLMERLNLTPLKGGNIIDNMPGYAEKPGYKARLVKAMGQFLHYDQLLVMSENLWLDPFRQH